MVNQERDLLQKEIDRLTSLVLNQQRGETRWDTLKRTPTLGEVDIAITPVTASGDSKADGVGSFLKLDLMKVDPD